MVADPTSTARRSRRHSATVREPSLVLVNTGDGKGKSTAAFGTAMRAVARGWKVGIIQFVKSGEWNVGEEEIGRRSAWIGGRWVTGSPGIRLTWKSRRPSPERDGRVARERIASGDYDLVVLDEITYPINWGWIDLSEVIDVIDARPERVNLIFTGRDAPDELIEVADTVTEMRKVKHAFDRGVMARRGIDY